MHIYVEDDILLPVTLIYLQRVHPRQYESITHCLLKMTIMRCIGGVTGATCWRNLYIPVICIRIRHSLQILEEGICNKDFSRIFVLTVILVGYLA